MHGCICGLCSVPMVCVSALVPGAYCLEHYSFVIYFEANSAIIPLVLLILLEIAVALLNLLCFDTNFRIAAFISLKKIIRILMAIALKMRTDQKVWTPNSIRPPRL